MTYPRCLRCGSILMADPMQHVCMKHSLCEWCDKPLPDEPYSLAFCSREHHDAWVEAERRLEYEHDWNGTGGDDDAA